MGLINKDQKSECYRLRKEGYTLQWLGDKYGLSRERIRQIVKTHERKLSGENKRLTDCIYPELRKWMIKNDLTFTSMAALCGVSMATIRNGLIGASSPSKYTIDRILEVTGLTYEDAFRK